MYYIYILRCEDNSLYTGITNNLDRRLNEHLTKNDKCAKYTIQHTALKLEIAWKTETRKLACKLEYHIKTLTKLKKEELIKNSNKLGELLKEKIDYKEYKKLE